MAQNFTADTAAASTKPARKTRAKKIEVVEPVIVQNLSTLDAGDDLDALLSSLTGETTIEADDAPETKLADPDEVDLDALLAGPMAELVDVPVETETTEEDLEVAVSRAEAVELMMESATPEVDNPGAVPTEAATKGKRVATPRKHYSDKVERLKDRMGASLSEYTVLTTADAMVDEEGLAVVMERTLEIIRQMNSKEKNRASNFIEFLSNKRAKLNNVLERVLKVLDRDGYLQTGAEGNVIKDLLARPYSMASARAMGGNTIGMYADLKVILPDTKGRYVANPDSLLLAKARSLLAAPVSAEAAPAA